MRIVASILLAGLLAVPTMAQRRAPHNWTGWADSATVTTFRADSLKYTRAFVLTDYEDVRAIVLANDTDAAGFASDSLKFRWGYQTGSLVLDSAGVLDTLWDMRVVLDTMRTDSLGKWFDTVGTVVPAGTLTRYWASRGDTTQIRGYACQSRWFVPEWDVLIRYWAKGLTGNNLASFIKLVFVQERRVGTGVVNK